MHFTGTKSSSSHIISKDDMFMPDYKKTSKQSRTYTVRQAARYKKLTTLGWFKRLPPAFYWDISEHGLAAKQERNLTIQV